MNSSLFYFLVRPLVPTHCRCRGLLLHRLHSLTHTFGRTPQNGGSAHRRDHYLTTHNTHDRHIRIADGIRTWNPSNPMAATHAVDRTFVPLRPKYSYYSILEIPDSIYFPQSENGSSSQKATGDVIVLCIVIVKFYLFYSFFWITHRRLNFICRRFGTLCSIFIGR